MERVIESCKYLNLSASGVVAGAGRLTGIFCATAGGSIQVMDGARIVVNTFTPLAGQFYVIPAEIGTSLIVTITGAVDCTVFYN